MIDTIIFLLLFTVGVSVILFSLNELKEMKTQNVLKVIFLVWIFICGLSTVVTSFGFLLDENQTPQYNETWECVEEMWDYNGMVCILTSKGYLVNLDGYSSKSPMEMCNGIIIEDLNLKLDIIFVEPQKVCTKQLKVRELVQDG